MSLRSRFKPRFSEAPDEGDIKDYCENEKQCKQDIVGDVERGSEQGHKIKPDTAGNEHGERIFCDRVVREYYEKPERIERDGGKSCNQQRGHRGAVIEGDQPFYKSALYNFLNQFCFIECAYEIIIQYFGNGCADERYHGNQQRCVKFAEIEKDRFVRDQRDGELAGEAVKE